MEQILYSPARSYQPDYNSDDDLAVRLLATGSCFVKNFLLYYGPFLHLSVQRTPECCVCSWFHDRSDWVDQVLGAVCYMAAEVGGECGLVGNEVHGDCPK